MPGNPTQLVVNQEQGNVWDKNAKTDNSYDAWLKDRSMQMSRKELERGLER